MKKHLPQMWLVMLVAFSFPFFSQAQVGIGIEVPHESAQLEIIASGK